YSSLALPAGPGEVEHLYVHEIAAMRIPARVVFLSACSTATASTARPGGISSVARAFLVAGVPGVGATLWGVEDGGSLRLVESFHRELENGADAAAALRSAQLVMLRSPMIAERDPSVWATYTLTRMG